MKNYTTVVFLTTLLSACAHAGARPASASLAKIRQDSSKPDWIDGSSMEYPRQQYLVGVGMADDRQTAEDRARGEIAKIFDTVVTVNTDSSISQGEGTAAQSNSFSQSVSQTVQTASKKALQDVQVVEGWHDDATQQYYALAVLNRQKAEAAIKDKIQGLDGQAKTWYGQLQASTEKLARVKAAMKLLALFKARQNLNNELRVVDATGQGVPNPIDEAAVRPVAAKALASLDVVVALSGEQSGQIQTGLIDGLSAFGIEATTAAGGPADILLDGTLSTQPLQGDGSAWRWARSNMTVSLRDGATAKTFLQFVVTDRESSADYDEAVRRSQVALAKKASAQVQDAISNYFENQ